MGAQMKLSFPGKTFAKGVYKINVAFGIENN